MAKEKSSNLNGKTTQIPTDSLQPEIQETPEVIDVPQEVEELVVEEPKAEETPVEQPPVVVQEVPVAQVAPPPPVVKNTVLSADPNLSLEDNVLKFLAGKKDSVRINEFLKSYFPIKVNQPPAHLEKSASNLIRFALQNLVNSRRVEVAGNAHESLGMAHYPDNTGRTHYYNLDTLALVAKIL